MYVAVELPMGGGAQTREVSKIWTIICDNFETVRDMISVCIYD